MEICGANKYENVKLFHDQVVVSILGVFGAPVPPGELDIDFIFLRFRTQQKGVNTRSRRVTHHPKYGGKRCPNVTERKICSVIQCRGCPVGEAHAYQ